MERVLSGVHLKTALVYLDDIVVFGNSIAELKERLDEVFRKIEVAGLKLKAKKCALFQQQLKYLGHIISQAGISCDPDMLSSVKDWKTPQNVKGSATIFRFCELLSPLHQGICKHRTTSHRSSWYNKDTKETC